MADETKLSHAGRRACNTRTPLQPHPLGRGRLQVKIGSKTDQPDRTAPPPDRSIPRPGSGNLPSHVSAAPDDPPWVAPPRPPSAVARASARRKRPSHRLNARLTPALVKTPAHMNSNARSHRLKTGPSPPSSNARSGRLKRPLTLHQAPSHASAQALHLPQTSAQIGSNASPRRRMRPPSCRYVSATFTSRADNPLASMRLSALQRPRRPIARSTREWISPH